jgi:hypothetical protein
MVLLGTGYASDWQARGENEEEVRKLAVQKIGMGPKEILGVDVGETGNEAGEEGLLLVPNGVQEEVRGHRAENIWGRNGHLERLRGIKGRYDPGGRLGGHIKAVKG